MMRIRPKTIIVTSQYSLDACFPRNASALLSQEDFEYIKSHPLMINFLALAISPILDYLENEKKNINK